MRERNQFVSGTNNVICQFSGAKVKASDCQMTWDGYFVRKDLWEPRHPQDLIRGRADKQGVAISRPESTDSFLDTNDVTADSL